MVSNIEFKFDPSKPVGKRVLTNSIKVAGLPLIKSMKYSIATSEYLSEGKDGYDVFKETIPMMETNCPDLGDVLLNFFELSEGRKYREEFAIYKQNQDVISKNFIRTYIKDKIENNTAALSFVELWKQGKAKVDDITEKFQKNQRTRSSSTFSKDGDEGSDVAQVVINVIGR